MANCTHYIISRNFVKTTDYEKNQHWQEIRSNKTAAIPYGTAGA